MKLVYIKKILCSIAFVIYFNICTAELINTAAFAKCEDSKKEMQAANNVVQSPNDETIKKYIAILKRRALMHGIKRDFESQADDYRSMLYFFRKDKTSNEYIKYKNNLDKTYAKLGFKNIQNNRLEIAKNLFLEEKYFASAFEFFELANEDYSKEICYEYLGDISQKFNNPNSAIIFYKKAIEITPDNYCIHYKLGKIYKILQQNDGAKDSFETAISLTDDKEILEDIIKLYEDDIKYGNSDETVYEILGLAYQKLKNYEKTYELFKKAMAIKPDDIFLQYYLANLLFDMTEYKNAISIYDSIISANPYESQIRIARAKSLKAIGKKDAAIKDYQVVLAIYPDSKQAQYGLYKILSGSKTTTDIVKSFYPLNKKFIPSAEFYNNLASILYQKNMVNDAINVYRKSIATAPKAPNAYIQLYKIYELEGQTSKAYEIARQAYRNLPKNTEIKNMYQHINKNSISQKNSLALSYMSNKEYSQAIKIYNQIQPKDAGTYESLALCYKALKNYNAAIKNLAQAIKLDPLNSDLYYNTALLYLDLNNKKTAENYLNKAVGLDKKNLKARKLLAYIKQQATDSSLNKAYNLYKKRNYKGTIAELNRAEKLYPNNPEVYFYKALTYNNLNDINNAYKNFTKTLSLDRTYYVSHFYMAEILEKQGKERQALEEYERFLGADAKDEKMIKKAQDKVIKLGEKYY